MSNAIGQAVASAAVSKGVSVAATAATGNPVIGEIVGKAVGMFSSFFGGGGLQRQSINATIGQYGLDKTKVTAVAQKNASPNESRAFGEAVGFALDDIVSKTGVPFGRGFNIGSNIGTKDTGTFFGNDKISDKAYDVGAVVDTILKKTNYDTKLLTTPQSEAQAAKLSAENSGAGNVKIQTTNDPYERLASKANSSSLALLGGIGLFLLALYKRGN